MESLVVKELVEQIQQFLQEAVFVHVTNQWRLVEIELAKLQVQEPAAFKLLTDAWTDDGFLVAPPWAPSEPEG